MSGISKYKKQKSPALPATVSVTSILGGLRFIDSLEFMNASLERLVDSLTKDELKFLHKFIDDP